MFSSEEDTWLRRPDATKQPETPHLTVASNQDPRSGNSSNTPFSTPASSRVRIRHFTGYSLGNQILALMQCTERGIPPGPIATFMGWKEKGRNVRKGQKAIVLCMPVTCKRRAEDPSVSDCAADRPDTFTRFVYRPNWFVLAQTDGQDVEPLAIPEWDRIRALDTLGIVEEPFTGTDGNCQGYARQRSIAVPSVPM